MTHPMWMTRTAIAALVALPMTVLPAAAQETDATEPGAETGGADPSPMDATNTTQVVVSVAGEDVTVGDVQQFISTLPEDMRQAPPQQLIPFAVDQLILRELILQKAADAGMEVEGDAAATGETAEAPDETGTGETDMAEGGDAAEDGQTLVSPEEVAALTEENRVIEGFLEGEMEGVVTDEAVQAAYDEISEAATTEVPPLDAVRPQIEQQLRQDRLTQLRGELETEVEIVFYGPDGEPRAASTEPDEG